jgi:hypothetical protein
LAVAKAQAALGLLLDARATALEVVGLPVEAGEPQVFERARASAGELERRLEQRLPSVLVEIFPASAQARIVIDGAPVAGARQAPVPLNPGRHQVVATATGYFDIEQDFELREGEPRRLRLTLQPVREDARSGAVAAAGASASKAPTPSNEAVAAAPAPDQPEAGDDATAADSPGSSARQRGYAALGVTGLAVAIGATTGILAFTSKPDCPGDVCPAGSEPSIRESTRYGTIANISFAVAAVSGAYALWELLANADSSTSQASASALPPVAFTPSATGVLCEWRTAF